MATKKTKKAAKPGVGALARELILAGKSNAEVLEAIQKKFPDSKANAGTVGWYRNQLKAAGKRVKDSRDITAASKKAAKPKAKAAKKTLRKNTAGQATDAPVTEAAAEEKGVEELV